MQAIKKGFANSHNKNAFFIQAISNLVLYNMCSPNFLRHNRKVGQKKEKKTKKEPTQIVAFTIFCLLIPSWTC